MSGERPYRELGTRIRALRQAAGRNQSDCAQRAGMHQSQLSLVEHGYQRPGLERLRRLADVLGADYEELARLAGYRR